MDLIGRRQNRRADLSQFTQRQCAMVGNVCQFCFIPTHTIPSKASGCQFHGMIAQTQFTSQSFRTIEMGTEGNGVEEILTGNIYTLCSYSSTNTFFLSGYIVLFFSKYLSEADKITGIYSLKTHPYMYLLFQHAGKVCTH